RCALSYCERSTGCPSQETREHGSSYPYASEDSVERISASCGYRCGAHLRCRVRSCDVSDLRCNSTDLSLERIDRLSEQIPQCNSSLLNPVPAKPSLHRLVVRVNLLLGILEVGEQRLESKVARSVRLIDLRKDYRRRTSRFHSTEQIHQEGCSSTANSHLRWRCIRAKLFRHGQSIVAHLRR